MLTNGLGILLAMLVVIGLAEWGVRIWMPQVNPQDMDHSLFQDRRFGDSYGWRPGARGEVFGAKVSIAEDGFLPVSGPRSPRETWLILGDSVAAGVGVPAAQGFVQRVQDHLEGVRLRNSSVPGYAVENERAVLQTLLARGEAVDRVWLFFCLNDVYPTMQRMARSAGLGERLFGFLRRHSRLYLAVKGLLLDRSRYFAEHDLALYRPGIPAVRQAVQGLSVLAENLDARGIPFTVFLLPYEFQLRSGAADALAPQRLLREALDKAGVRVEDLSGQLKIPGEDSRRLFLFGDPMHLSDLGHQRVAQGLLERLPGRWAEQSLQAE